MSQEDDIMDRDEFKPTPIKIPKVDPNRNHLVYINTTDVKETPYGYLVTLKKQVIAGITIPHGTVMHVIGIPRGTMIEIMGDDLNKLLRILYFDSLRTKKK